MTWQVFRGRRGSPRMNAADTPGAGRPVPDEGPSEGEPRVRGESLHDRITSFLMAVVIGATLVVAWLVLWVLGLFGITTTVL